MNDKRFQEAFDAFVVCLLVSALIAVFLRACF